MFLSSSSGLISVHFRLLWLRPVSDFFPPLAAFKIFCFCWGPTVSF